MPEMNQNEILKNYVLQRDDNKCQWPGCATIENTEVLFVLETEKNPAEGDKFNQNGITLCPAHAEIVHLHEATFGPLIFDLIRLVEFESDLKETEKAYRNILNQSD